MRRIFIPLLFAFFACNKNTAEKNETGSQTEDLKPISAKKTIHPAKASAEDGLQQRLLGVWADGSTQNGSFLIEKDHKITYIEDENDYTYSLHGDSITIKSADTIYTEKVSFKADTLIFSDKDQQRKFWKFKD